MVALKLSIWGVLKQTCFMREKSMDSRKGNMCHTGKLKQLFLTAPKNNTEKYNIVFHFQLGYY